MRDLMTFKKLNSFTLDMAPYKGQSLTIQPQAGPQVEFMSRHAGYSGKPQREQDFPLIFYGGAAGGGKSWSLLADALKYIDCPNFYAVFFRKTIKQLRRTLWKEAKKMYMPLLINKEGKFVGKANIKEQEMLIVFPTGAMVEFSYLDRDADAEMNWQGAELTAAYFDEFTHFSEYCFNYIRTRMRSDSKYSSFIRCGLNPHPTHFVHKYLDIFIQEDGFAKKECSGKPAYFIVDSGQIVTSWDKEGLIKRYPKKKPRKFTMIPSSLDDNPYMLSKNEDYRENLEANDPANAAMLLAGNWKYTPAANGVFDVTTVTGSQIVSKIDIPEGCTYYRAYDKASAVPAKEGGDSKTLDPDYTCSILFAVDKDKNIYVLGDYIKDQKTGEELSRYRKKPGPRDILIRDQCLHDITLYGDYVYCILPRDPAQAGESEQLQAMKDLIPYGIKVKQDPSHGNKSKQVRFEPFCIKCYSLTVYWVKDSFDVATWDYMLLELMNFNPYMKPENNGFHDDIVDCFSSAYSACMQLKSHTPPSLPDFNSPTLSTSLAGNIGDSGIFW